MKKFFILLPIVLSLFLLTSCVKTKFENLPQEQQDVILNDIKNDIIGPAFQEVVGIAFDFNLSEKEKEDKSNSIAEGIKVKIQKYMDLKYPNIDFNMDELSKIDNSQEEIVKNIETKKVKFKDPITLSGSGDETQNISILVSDIIWRGKTIENSYIEDAKNEYLAIEFKSENVGKKPNFFHLSSGVLVLRDGTEFNNADRININGCISCESNPGEKAEEQLLFDIKRVDLAGAIIRFKDIGVDFEL